MKPRDFRSRNARRALGALVGVAVLSGLGCDNSMSFSGPTAPDWPDWQLSEPGLRTVQIHGVLEGGDGTSLEATVLYDGQELVGARSRCPEPGCAGLELEATTLSASGHHTISFHVLSQSQEAIDYLARGTVVVSRERVALGGVAIPLGPTHARLEAGEAVTFELDLFD